MRRRNFVEEASKPTRTSCHRPACDSHVYKHTFEVSIYSNTAYLFWDLATPWASIRLLFLLGYCLNLHMDSRFQAIKKTSITMFSQDMLSRPQNL